MNTSEKMTGNSSSENKKEAKGGCCVGTDYDVSLKMYSDKEDNTPECIGQMKGASKQSICKLLAIGGAVAVGAALLVCATHVFCSWVCKSK